MARFVWSTPLPVPPEEAFAWHERPGAFERLLPPWQEVRILGRQGTIAPGGRLTLAVKKGPLWLRWEAEHGEWERGRFFTDRLVRGPFPRWEHHHGFLPREGGGCLLEDRVDYDLPLGAVGRLVSGRFMERDLRRLFAFRHERTRRDLLRHAAYRDRPRLRVAVTGASGLVGSALVPFLTTGGHWVLRLGRRPRREEGEGLFDPAAGKLEGDRLEGFDAVVHLAGENIAAGRWTPERKEAIRRSRVEGTAILARTLASLRRPPGVLVCASAVGFYGHRPEGEVTEDWGAGEGFLAEVCKEWEAAAEPARKAGIRVVHLRTGVVLSRRGGALARMLPAFRAGAGGPVGSGRQGFPWIALDDLVGLIHFLLFEEVRGPVNAVAPEAVSQARFARVLGRVLRRPAFLPLPAPAVRLLFGEMGQALLLEGASVRPVRAEAAGFAFQWPSLEEALRWELGLFQG
ncbi:MAG: TIGR01777 family oxidoreductase [Acidobacteriota bacterium]